MTVLDTLFLALGIDTKGIDKGLAQAQQKIDAGARSLANSLMSPFKAALGALAAGLSLGAVTKQYLQQADAIGKMADSIGTDMEELQAWGEASARAGGSAEAFKGTVQGMTRSLQMAANGAKGPAAQALQQLGVRATDASGKARDTFDVLRDLAGVMEGMDKQKAMGLGQRMGLDRGTIMLLQSGRAAVDDLVARQKELGVYTKEDAEIAAKANDAIADLGQSLKAAAAIVMRAIVPAITWVTEHLTALVQDFRKHKTFYLAALGAIAAFLTAKMIPTLVKVGLLNARIWAPYAILAALVAGIAVIFDDLWVYMHGGESALEDYWATLGTGPELLEKFTKAWERVKKIGQDALNTLQKIAQSVFDFFVRHIDDFILTFEGLWDVIEGLFNFDFEQIGRGLAKAFTGAWNIIQGVFKDIFSGMEKMSVWDAIANGAQLAWDAVKALAKGFFEGLPPEAQKYLSETWEKFKSFVHWDEFAAKFKWEDISGPAKAAFAFISDAVSDTIKFLEQAWNGAKKFFSYFDNVLPPLIEYWGALWDIIAGIFNFDFQRVGKGLSTAFTAAWKVWQETFNGLITAIGDGIKSITWESVTTSAQSVFESITTLGSNAWKAVKDFASGWFAGLPAEAQTQLTALWKGLEDGFKNAGKFFLDIFDIVPDFSKIKKAIEDAFKEAWDWIVANVPGVEWLMGLMKGTGKAADAVKQAADGVTKAADKAIQDAGVKDYEALAEQSQINLAAGPADAVPGSAVNNSTTNQTTVTQEDNRNVTINFQAELDKLAEYQREANKAFRNPPTWMDKQAATGQTF